MSRREVTTPSGEAWVVRRLWSPRLQGEHPWSRFRRRARGTGRRAGELADADPGCLDLGDLVAAVVILAVVLLAVFVVVPLLVAVVDLLLILVLTALGLAARVVFRVRPGRGDPHGRGDPPHLAGGRLAGQWRAGRRGGGRAGPRAAAPAGRRRVGPARRLSGPGERSAARCGILPG
jgi:hypothetical protein